MVGTVDKVDPMTMLLYQVHTRLSHQEVRTLTAIANVPQRDTISTGLDLFIYLNDHNKLLYDYLKMLLTSVSRDDLVDLLDTFYTDTWEKSAYAYTCKIRADTGSVPLVPRDRFIKVNATTEHIYDVFLHYHSSDSNVAEEIRKRAGHMGITFTDKSFEEAWVGVEDGNYTCRYIVPLLSKAYISHGLDKELEVVVALEVNPVVSLKRIIPVLVGITPDYIRNHAVPGIQGVAVFCCNAGLGEATTGIYKTVRKSLKTVVTPGYEPHVKVTCVTRDGEGKLQEFNVALSPQDTFMVGRSESGVVFRGDKGIKGCREGTSGAEVPGHCSIGTQPGGLVTMTGYGHPLTLVRVGEMGLPLPPTGLTLLLGKEWISIAGRRNVSQCMARIHVKPVNQGVALKVVAPKARDTATFTCCHVIIGSGEGSNVKLIVPGVDIGRQHCVIHQRRAGNDDTWFVKPVNVTNHVFAQLPRDSTCEVVLNGGHLGRSPRGGEEVEVLVGSSSVLMVRLPVSITDDLEVKDDEVKGEVKNEAKDASEDVETVRGTRGAE